MPSFAKNYQQFKKYLPRVQAYYAVKANPDPAIVKTLYDVGASFDVASMPEFEIVYENIKDLPAKQRQDWIWDKIIYANPIKANETLEELDQYKPLVTYDNLEEIRKIKKYAPHAGLALRIKVPNTGAMVELSSKFGAPPGEAVALIEAAHDAGLVVEGLSFHVGSQTTNFENFVQAINLSASIFAEAKSRGYKMKLLDIGGGFPAPYDKSVKPFRMLAKRINSELNRLFPKDIEILAEPGRFMVATAATAVVEDHRQSRARRKAVLLHQRWRLPHLLGHHLRPLQVSDEGVQEGQRRKSARCLGRPVMRWIRFRWGMNCRRILSLATWCTARTSAPTAMRRRRTSTAFRRRQWCMSINSRQSDRQDTTAEHDA